MSESDELPLRNDRMDAITYAKRHLDSALAGLQIPGERERGYIRDALALAFLVGETQERARAVRVVVLARDRATTPEARALVDTILDLLDPPLESR